VSETDTKAARWICESNRSRKDYQQPPSRNLYGKTRARQIDFNIGNIDRNDEAARSVKRESMHPCGAAGLSASKDEGKRIDHKINAFF